MGIHIVLGVTGSIAAYKSAELVSLLKKRGCEVKVILTKSGGEFITPLTLETLSKNRVITDMFDRNFEHEVGHISLAKWADIFVIAPATANFIAKYTYGIADDMLTTTVLATKAPVVIAPAMNTAMYEHETMQGNMRILRSRGVHFIEPESGLLACGDVGKGRMESPENICNFLLKLKEDEKTSEKKDFEGISVLVTAGATVEDIDPVRYITNRSTGKMGISIADAAKRRGAKVYLVAGNTHIKPSEAVDAVYVRSCADMCSAVKEKAPLCDIVISAAAPADFTPKKYTTEKIKKGGQSELTLSLVPTEDILKSISDKAGRVHIGFAAETNDIESNARKKLESKNLDAIAANDVSKEGSGFGLGKDSLTLYRRDGGVFKSGSMEKESLADWLLDRVIEIYDDNKG